MARRLQPRPLPDPRRDSPIINGDFNVWQRGTSFASAIGGTRLADMWVWYKVTTGAVVDITRSTDVPSVSQLGHLAQYSIQVDCTTADGSVGAADLAQIGTHIEGYRWSPFAQRAFSIGLWVKSTKTGQFYVSLSNSGLDRSIILPYTVNATNTWEWKTVYVPASPSAGTWSYTTDAGVFINWALMSGSNYQTSTVGSWVTGDFHSTSSGVNALDSTSNNFLLHGVRMSPGPVVIPGYDLFDEEYRKCQRYYQKSFNYDTAPVQNAGAGTGEHTFHQIVGASTSNGASHRLYFEVPMRVAPTITTFNAQAANSQVRNHSVAADCSTTAIANITEKGFHVVFTTAAGSAIGNSNRVHWTAEAGIV